MPYHLYRIQVLLCHSTQ